jgi:predicted Zn-dependent peptidase
MLQYSPGAGYGSEHRYVLRVLSTILGDDTGSRLFWELVDNGLAESAVAFTQEFEECGLFCTYLACSPQQKESNWEILQNILASANENPISEREIELAKNKICSGMILGSERPSNRLFSVGHAWLNREKYETVAEAVQHYKKVTRDQLQESFASLIHRVNVTVTVSPE